MNSRSDDTNYFMSPHSYRRNSGQESMNAKYAFNSPQQTQHTLPTPYTLNQNKLNHMNPIERDNSELHDCSLVENSMLNHHNHQRHQRHSHRSVVDPNTSSNDIGANSSQILTDSDHSINTEFSGAVTGSTCNDVGMLLSASNQRMSASQGRSSNEGSNLSASMNSTRTTKLSSESPTSPSSAPNGRTAIAGSNVSQSILPDINEQPSSVLHFGNFANELLLASPEQFKEFLMDSPAGLNFWQQRQTPAKTPLKFVTNNTNLTHQQNDPGLMNSIHSPLQNIDVNLMFNSGYKAAFSPPRKQMSLTPYGRRILNEIGTPFTKIMQPTSSNNSALVDFHRARKHNLQSTPTSRPGLGNDSPGSRMYGSSPTTIQLHSSGIKCSPERDPNIDEKLFHLRASPTPKLSMSKSQKLQLNSNFELPKMGSFKEELTVPPLSAPSNSIRSADPSSNASRSISGKTHQPSSSTSEKVRKQKLNRNGNKNKSKASQLVTKQRFQIIMTDTTSFNSDDGIASGNQTKLKRSRSVIVPGETKKRKKEEIV
ncbi:unnamed protein product [Kluyveromyces dobzhanskii CBS 2104]|uniref:WGS project CCBQ000000000 data, contig 00272 n=1 Tax=Kluyveromyces dobzhanskii CBS 2104 TaxID=1427455 RepID=A0A0A8L8K5_9SACH|nr:unnamed protein product [Kluyveromyces dobzhanskii CBS 2104]